MKKKYLFTIFILTLLLTSCSEKTQLDEQSAAETTESFIETTEVSQQEKPEDENVSADEKEDPSAKETETVEEEPEVKSQPPKVIDPFENLEVQFDGIAPYINVSINNSGCSEDIQQNVTFTYDDTKLLKNGDELEVKAEYDEDDLKLKNIRVEHETQKYRVEDMPFYVEDLSKLDRTALDEELQKYMDSKYMFAGKEKGLLEHEGTHASALTESTAKIMGVNLDNRFGAYYFDKFNSSNVENSYSLCLKPELMTDCKPEDSRYSISPSNTFNYYYRLYHNSYAIREYEGVNDKYENHESEDVDIYVFVYMKNIIAYPDGTFKYDMSFDHSGNILQEQAYFEAISSKNDSYNITEIG